MLSLKAYQDILYLIKKYLYKLNKPLLFMGKILQIS
jgi:hypothetical protein